MENNTNNVNNNAPKATVGHVSQLVPASQQQAAATAQTAPAAQTTAAPQAVVAQTTAAPQPPAAQTTSVPQAAPAVSPYAPAAQTSAVPVAQATAAQAAPAVPQAAPAVSPYAPGAQMQSATPAPATQAAYAPASAASAAQASAQSAATQPNPATAPAINPATINPMPAKPASPANNETSAKANTDKTPIEEESGKKAKEDKKNNRKGMPVWASILISAAVGLLVSVIATVGLFMLQSRTSVLDKILVAEVDPDADIDEEPEEDPDAEDPDADTDVDTDNTDPSANTSNTSNNSFNTAYTTVITGQSDVITVVENAMPSMVSIIKEYNYVDSSLTQYFGNYTQGQNFVVEASGSGFIIAETDTEFLIVSNNHVVENPISLEITFVDGSTAAGYIKGCDKGRDLAVVAVLKSDISDETVSQIRIASLGDSGNLKLGEQVVAIGNALGYGQSVTTGIVSALDREVETEPGNINKFIQTDAAINPGNSGGALLNMAGQVIGINSAKLAETSVEGMGYAIPISDVTEIIEELMEHSTKIPLPDDEVGYIGISLQEVTASLSQRFNMPVGIYIVETVDGGAAEAAGLQEGDIITEFAGEKVESYDELDKVLQCHAAGETVTVKYQRSENGTYVEHTTQLTLGSKP